MGKRGVIKSLVIVAILGVLLPFSVLPVYADTNYYKVRTRVAEAIDYEKSYSSIGTGTSNTQTINGSVGYSYAEKVIIQVYFSDNLVHTGRLTFTNAVANTLWISDDDNVAVIADTIYFYNKSAFNLYTYKYHYNQSLSGGNLVLDSTADITLGTLTEVTNPNDVSTLLNTISTTLSTISTRVTNIRSYTQSILNEIQNSDYGIEAIALELKDQGLTLDDILVDTSNIYSTLSAMQSYIEARHDWDIPVESFGINWSLFYNLAGYQSIANQNYWSNYPIFTVPANTTIFNSYISSASVSSGIGNTIIIGINGSISSQNGLNNYFQTDSSSTLTFVRQIASYQPGFQFIEFTITSSTSGQHPITYIGSNGKLIGIYHERYGQSLGLSTSFMENWFSTALNDAGDDLDDAADDLIDASDDLSDDIDDLHQMDVDALDDMDDALDNIDLTFNINNISKFSSSASWVRSQFNWLTTQEEFSYFGYVITFSLTIGLVLVLLGKLRS